MLNVLTQRYKYMVRSPNFYFCLLLCDALLPLPCTHNHWTRNLHRRRSSGFRRFIYVYIYQYVIPSLSSTSMAIQQCPCLIYGVDTVWLPNRNGLLGRPYSQPLTELSSLQGSTRMIWRSRNPVRTGNRLLSSHVLRMDLDILDTH